ncbi:hypothetical protein HED50_20235 [Ochrobactrum oryzae]|nr:hypothetical protein [Brucella oryzae]
MTMFAGIPDIPSAAACPAEADSCNISARNEYASAGSEAEFNRSFANAISVNTPHHECCAAVSGANLVAKTLFLIPSQKY